jgi:hypothetical protein
MRDAKLGIRDEKIEMGDQGQYFIFIWLKYNLPLGSRLIINLDGYYTSGSRDRCDCLTSRRHATQYEMLKALTALVPLFHFISR